jgi:carboxyl-terminal processing protease
MRSLALALLFIAVVPLASGSLKPEQESEYWKDTGLDRAFLSKLISNELCYQGEQYYDSCRRAIYAGALLTGHQAQFSGVRDAKFPKRLEFDFLASRVLEGAGDKLPMDMLVGKMINAQLQVFDKYAQIIPTAFLSLLLNGDSKTYYDLGIETEISAAGLYVFHVHPNTPASASGLRVNDRIVSVNGILARTMEEARFVAGMWVGKRDQHLVIEVERAGRTFVIETQTAPVSIDDFEVGEYESGGKTYGYLRLLRFGKGSCSQIEARLEHFKGYGEKLGGVVLDLRHNGGGMVEEGQCIAQLFMGGVPVIDRVPVDLKFPAALKFPMGSLTDLSQTLGVRSVYKDMPLAVLIDSGSKSMSEVVSGALQGYGRAWVVGERSYGKSTVQLSKQLPGNEKLRLLRTAGKFQLPHAILRSEPGTAPDFNIPFARHSSKERRIFAREFDGVSPAPARQDKVKISACVASDRSRGFGRFGVEAGAGFRDEQLAFALSVLACVK